MCEKCGPDITDTPPRLPHHPKCKCHYLPLLPVLPPIPVGIQVCNKDAVITLMGLAFKETFLNINHSGFPPLSFRTP
jgi:hypothetical protein